TYNLTARDGDPITDYLKYSAPSGNVTTNYTGAFASLGGSFTVSSAVSNANPSASTGPSWATQLTANRLTNTDNAMYPLLGAKAWSGTAAAADFSFAMGPSAPYSYFNIASTTPAATNTVKLTYDFTGLGDGYLPAGSYLFFQDVDIVGVEDYTFVGTLASVPPGGNLSWLSKVGDYGSGTAATFVTTNATIAGEYELNSAGSTDEMLNIFKTTQNLTGLVVDTGHSSSSGGSNFGIALEVIPEPSSLLLLALGGVGLAVRRKLR
ncbi:MAG: PEP-CTERM sorting domain-containing protein, partial [Chthoniobacterales bacterium]